MSDNRARMDSRTLLLNVTMLLVGVVLLAIVIVSSTAASDFGDALTRNTIRLSLTWYAVAICLMMFLQRTDWYATTGRGLFARWCWTWAAASYLVHVAAAFHFFDYWSHQLAFERTRMVSGFGEGLYVSYLFTVLWMADVAYWWIFPSGYSQRPRWINRSLHGFMLFIVFNATVIFEEGTIRLVGLSMFLLFAIVWFLPKSPQARGVS